MKELLSEQSLDHFEIEADGKSFAKLGYHPIIVARKVLNIEETRDLEMRINEAMSLV
jgi:hypothetical protein